MDEWLLTRGMRERWWEGDAAKVSGRYGRDSCMDANESSNALGAGCESHRADKWSEVRERFQGDVSTSR